MAQTVQQINQARIKEGEYPKMMRKAGWRSVFKAADEFWSVRHQIDRYDALLSVLVQDVGQAIDSKEANYLRLWKIQQATASLYRHYPTYLTKEDQ